MATDPSLIQAAAGAAPHLDPATIVAAAQAAATPMEAAGNAQAAGQYGNTTTLMNALIGQPVAQQHTLWQSYSPSEQQQLAAVGYKPPSDPQEMGKPGRGIFGDIGHVFGMAGDALGDVGHVVARAGGDVLNAAASPLRAVQHVFRAERWMMDQDQTSNQHGLAGLTGTWGLLNPASWARSWKSTMNGKSTFLPSAVRVIQEKYGDDPQLLHIAEQAASGIPTAQIVNGFPASQRDAINQKMQSPEFNAVVQEFNNAHITVGQSTVGEKFLNDHPLAGHLISGAMDAAADWNMDPMNKPLTALVTANRIKYAVSEGEAARYMISDGAEADAANSAVSSWSDYMNGKLELPQVSRSIDQAGTMLARGQLNAFRTTYARSLGRVTDQLVADGVDSAPKLREWIAGQSGMDALLSGKAARSSATIGGSVVIPHVTPIGWARDAFRGAMRTKLDDLIDKPHALSGVDITPDMLSDTNPLGIQPTGETPENLAQLADHKGFINNLKSTVRTLPGNATNRVLRLTRTLGQYTASVPAVDLSDANGFEQLRRTLLSSLPVKTVDQIGNFWVHGDVAQRFAITQGSVAQMLHYAGAFAADPEGSQKLMDAMDATYRNQAYAPLGIDKMADGSRTALLQSQLSDRVHLPSLTEVRKLALQGDFLGRAGVPLPFTGALSGALRAAGNAGRLSMSFWRPLMLARIGFPIRVALDENGNYMIRNGVMPMIRARAALHGYKGDIKALAKARDAAAALERGADPETVSWARSVASIVHKVPTAILSGVKNMRELGTATLAEHAWASIPAAQREGLTKSDYYRFADLMLQRHDAWTPMISAVHGAGGGYDQAEHLKNVMLDGKPVLFKLHGNGLWSESRASDDPGLFRAKWSKALDTYGSDPASRAVLENIDKHPDTQMRHALSIIESDDYAKARSAAVRSRTLPSGHIVGVDKNVTQAVANRDWARKIVAATNALVRGSDGNLIRPVVDEMLENRGSPAMDTLNAIDHHALPQTVIGPDVVPIHTTTKLLGGFMNHMAGLMDRLAREPNYLHAGTRAMKDLEPMVRALQGEGPHADALLGDLAVKRGIEALKPFIHSPELKTQFEVLHRTAAPFLFAQHQFLQRWGRTLLDNPAAIRKAMLTFNGLQTSGIVHNDSSGQASFYYPMSGAATDVLTHILSTFGFHSTLPVTVPFTGELKNTVPGFNNMAPSLGPFAAIPLHFLGNLDPGLHAFENTLNPLGANENYLGQVLPSTASRLIEVISGNGATMASMQLKAIQDAEATGHGLLDIARDNGHLVNGTPVPTAADKTQWLKQIKNWARVNMMMTAALGFVAPASPQQNFDPHNLDSRLQELLAEMPYNDAITEFLRENPGATPWTVSKSPSVGGGVLPAAASAGDWITSNLAFIQAHPQAAGWLIPRTTGNAPFDPNVYSEQIEYGLRNEDTPSQFLDEVSMAPSAQSYYQAYDQEQAAITAAGNNSSAKTQLRGQWDQWQAQFLALNPTFADYLNSGSKAVQRQQTIEDLNAALSDPALPKSPQTDNVRAMVQSLDDFTQTMIGLEGNYTSAATTERTNLKNAYIEWGTAQAQQAPDVSDLWNLLIRPSATEAASTYQTLVAPVVDNSTTAPTPA